MTAAYDPDQGLASARQLDPIGLIAFTAFPVVALYQGIAAALGFVFVFDAQTAVVLPLAAILLAALIRLPVLARRWPSAPIRRAAFYFAGFLLVLFVSTLLVSLDPIERDPARMLQQFLSTAGGCLVFIVMLAAPSPSVAVRTFAVALVIWAAAAILTPLTALTPFPIGEVQGVYAGSQGVRSFGVLGDGGTFVVSFLAVAFFVSRRFVWFALALIALIISGSRSPMVITAAGIGLALVLSTPGAAAQRPGGRAIRVVVASVVTGLLLVGMQVLFGALAGALGARNTFERFSETGLTESDRFFSIVQGLEWAQLSPIYGSGFNAYYFFSLRSAAFGANASNALNQIVQTLVDGGIVALALLILFFYETLRPGRGMLMDRRIDPYGLRVWMIAFVVLNQTAVYIGPASSLTPLVFGICGTALFLREAALSPRRVPPPATGPVQALQR